MRFSRSLFHIPIVVILSAILLMGITTAVATSASAVEVKLDNSYFGQLEIETDELDHDQFSAALRLQPAGSQSQNSLLTEYERRWKEPFLFGQTDASNTFITRARLLAGRHGTKTGRVGTMNDFDYIPDEDGKPFAVLKSDTWGQKRTAKEAFVSQYGKAMGLRNIAESVIVRDMKIEGRAKPFSGLVEEFISHKGDQDLPKDLDALVAKFQSHNSLLMQPLFAKHSPNDVTVLLKYLETDSVHALFLAVLLMSGEDSDFKNIGLRLNNANKLEPIAFDTELYFKTDTVQRSFIYTMPFVDVPLSEGNRELVRSWTPEKLKKFGDQYFKKLGPDGDLKFRNQLAKARDLQAYVLSNPKAAPLDIMLFAFFKTRQHQFEGNLDSQGVSLVKEFARYSDSSRVYYPDTKAGECGDFFEGGLKDTYRGFAAAIYDFLETPANNAESITLADFVNFIPTLSYFKKDKLEEFREYVEKTLNLKLNA